MYEIDELFDKRSIIGAKLESILDEKKCTKTELCKNTKVSRPTIDKLLAGTLTNKTTYKKHMEKILKYLQITPDALLKKRDVNQNNIRRIRNIYEITADEMSLITGISLEKLKQIESGENMSIAELRDIAMVFSTSSNALCDKSFFEPQIKKLNDFWGHIGVLLNNTKEYLWFPITKETYLSIYRKRVNDYMVIPCMNNRVLFLCMKNIKELIFLDDACDNPIDINWDQNVSCGELPLVVYEALEDYILNDDNVWEECVSDNLKKFLDKFIKSEKLTYDEIFHLLNYSTIHYNDGNKRSLYIDFVEDESISTEIVDIYAFETSEFLEQYILINEINGYDILLNLNNISMLDLPLLKLENRIYEMQENE